MKRLFARDDPDKRESSNLHEAIESCGCNSSDMKDSLHS